MTIEPSQIEINWKAKDNFKENEITKLTKSVAEEFSKAKSWSELRLVLDKLGDNISGKQLNFMMYDGSVRWNSLRGLSD